MDDFTLRLTLPAEPEAVYEAVLNADQWWSRHVDLKDQGGEVMTFRFPSADFHVTVRIEALDPGRHVEWVCLDAKHPRSAGYANPRDWVGTRMHFDVETAQAGQTHLVFTHVGLTPQLESHEACAEGWNHYVGKSLKALVESGRGEPFDDGPQAA